MSTVHDSDGPGRIRLSALAFERQFRRFERQIRYHSGQRFTSFQQGLPADWEEYKGDVRKEALRRLAAHKWRPSDVGSGEILKRVISAIEIREPRLELRNNLVAWTNRFGPKSRPHRALLEAQSDKASRSAFEDWFLRFFSNAASDEAEAFENFREMAGDRYDLVAYLFFLKDSSRFMPIATTVFDEAFELLEIDVVTAHHCSWSNYAAYNAAINEVRVALRDIAGVEDARLIDAHSFCWMLVRQELPAMESEVAIPLPRPLGTLTADENLEGISRENFRILDEEYFSRRDAERRRLGSLAQDIALQSERRRLREGGHPAPENAAAPVWFQPGRGYDILSRELKTDEPRHIEVKAATLRGDRLTFFLTANERQQSVVLPNYYIYVVIGADSRTPVIYTLRGSDVPAGALKPLNYLASVRTNIPEQRSAKKSLLVVPRERGK